MDLKTKAEHIRDMLGSHAPEEQRRILHDLLNAVPAPEEPSIAIPEDFIRIFRHLLFAAIFPHVGNPQPPWNHGITTRPLAWQWILQQMHNAVQDDWPLRACIPQLLDCTRQVLQTWAECEYPLYFSPRMLVQFQVICSSLSSICMSLQDWDFNPPSPLRRPCQRLYCGLLSELVRR